MSKLCSLFAAFSLFYSVQLRAEEIMLTLNIDTECSVTLTAEANISADRLEYISKVVLPRTVIDKEYIDIEAVRNELPEIDFSKRIFDIDEGEKIEKITRSLGPWRLKRSVMLNFDNILECEFSKDGVLESVSGGELPIQYPALYSEVSGN